MSCASSTYTEVERKINSRMPPTDHIVRLAAFKWLEQQVAIHGEVLPRRLLEQGFQLEANRISLIGPQGIWKPAILDRFPLSITTTPESTYKDGLAPSGLLNYSYRGTDPQHRDNTNLRDAMVERVPIIYFFGLVRGKYLAVWPVFIVGDSPADLTFTVAVDDYAFVRLAPGETAAQEEAEPPGTVSRRAYITTLTRKRLHQQGFRERVIDAYRQQCACCRLRHEELLDAAHIVPDSDPEGEPVVQNGISLCKLHHAAFDSFIIGITPEYIVRVRRDILDEADGPMLRHGLQGMDGQRIELPMKVNLRPHPEFLERRYELFRKALGVA